MNLSLAAAIVLTLVVALVIVWAVFAPKGKPMSPFDELAKIRKAQEERLVLTAQQTIALESIAVSLKQIADVWTPPEPPPLKPVVGIGVEFDSKTTPIT